MVNRGMQNAALAVTTALAGKVSPLNRKLLVLSLICALILAGCAALWEPAVHGVSLETTDTKQVRVTDVTLYRMDQGLLLMGEVGVHSLATRLKGYVEVQVVGPDGDVLVSRRPDQYLRSEMHDETDQRYTFSLELPLMPAKGSHIRVNYHAGDDEK